MTTRETIMTRIRTLNIPHEYHEHAPAHTMEDCLALPYAASDVTFCKNLLLCNTPRTVFFLYVTVPDKPFRTSDVSKRLGSSRLSFAPPECLPEMLHLEPGSLSPLGLWFDPENRIRLAFDRDVQRPGRIAFHPCDNTATVLFDQRVFWEQVVPALGHEPVFI
ncbi:MAG: prolyl-tRNA synthetase associated domain-containing protein [Clostridia bacterium]|nr:prolyl-tRNA synthetase associated domain-containing protein [Clostridia bacterium]